MAAAVWCKEHAPTKTIVHRMNDIIGGTGLNALQLFVQNFKQADLGLTGTVRKATLLNQSSKVTNPISITFPSNRRSSTIQNGNGASIGRGSISHINVKIEEGAGSFIKVEDFDKTCVTCGIDVSPRWYPFPPIDQVSVPIIGASVQLLNDNGKIGELLTTNGHIPQDSGIDNGGPQVALAVAALHRDTGKPIPPYPVPNPTDFQCHKCHSKKAQKEPSPHPLSPQRDDPKVPIAVTNITIPDQNISQPLPHYTWPHPPSHPSNNSYNSWSRRSPTPQSVVQISQLNGNHSPRVGSIGSQPLIGQPQSRHPIQAIPQSPRQNGHMSQATNGYPTSPRRSMSSSGIHMQNGAYSTYSRLAPQHLTNGGPPPRAPEHPFTPGSTHMHPHSSYNHPPHGSPPISREPLSQGRDLSNSHNNNNNSNQPLDGRINGGASASPSLRNLLS
jgi:hypothetical protein